VGEWGGLSAIVPVVRALDGAYESSVAIGSRRAGDTGVGQRPDTRESLGSGAAGYEPRSRRDSAASPNERHAASRYVLGESIQDTIRQGRTWLRLGAPELAYAQLPPAQLGDDESWEPYHESFDGGLICMGCRMA
jgi:hypothetical protein